MPRSTWGPLASTRSAPWRTAMWANASGFPLSSPSKNSSRPVTWVRLAPSAPACMYATTRSARRPAVWISAAAANRSSRLETFEYGAKPTNATRTPPSSTTAIWPRNPVCAMPWAASAALVCRTPAAPKSCEWLFALFSTSNPAFRRYPAYDGGTRKAKQSDEPDPHFESVAVVSVPSRFPNVMGARSASRTRARYVPGWAGSVGVFPSMVSPTAAMVTVGFGAPNAGVAPTASAASATTPTRIDLRPRTGDHTCRSPCGWQDPSDHDGSLVVASVEVVAQLAAGPEPLGELRGLLPGRPGLRVLPGREGQEMPRVALVPDQARGLQRGMVLAGPLEEPGPPLDELLFLPLLHVPVPRGVVLGHLRSPFRPCRSPPERHLTAIVRGRHSPGIPCAKKCSDCGQGLGGAALGPFRAQASERSGGILQQRVPLRGYGQCPGPQPIPRCPVRLAGSLEQLRGLQQTALSRAGVAGRQMVEGSGRDGHAAPGGAGPHSGRFIGRDRVAAGRGLVAEFGVRLRRQRVQLRVARRAVPVSSRRPGCRPSGLSGPSRVPVLQSSEGLGGVQPSPHVAGHARHRGQSHPSPDVRLGHVQVPSTGGQLAQSLPGQRAGTGSQLGVDLAGALQAGGGLVPPPPQQQRLAQQAPRERLGPPGPGPGGQLERPPRVFLDPPEQLVSVQVVLPDAVVDVEEYA